jgi:hypothetical protein
LAASFRPIARDAGRRRADPDQPRIDHGLRELGILGQEAIAGVDRLRAGRLRRRDDPLAHQIAFPRRRRPDMHCRIGLAHMQRIGVRIRIDRDRADAHPRAVRMIRQAISPRLAIRMDLIMQLPDHFAIDSTAVRVTLLHGGKGHETGR